MAGHQCIVMITGGKPLKLSLARVRSTNGLRIANSGIGLELVSQLLDDPSKHVILCSRSMEKGEKALNELKAKGKPGNVELLQLDVTDEQSIANAAQTITDKHGRCVVRDASSISVVLRLTSAGSTYSSIMVRWAGKKARWQKSSLRPLLSTLQALYW